MGLKNEAHSALKSTKSFYKEYITGMNKERFNKEFRSDTERLKQLYKENVEELSKEQGVALTGSVKFFKFISALTQRLNPTRRLLFGVGNLAFFGYYILSFFDVVAYIPLSGAFLPLSFLSVLMLLMVELLEKSDVKREIDLARKIQLSLLPGSSSSLDELEFSSFAHTANEVGGDYVDVITTDKGVYAIVADVSGKGLSAALYMVRMQALVHLLVQKSQPSPKELFLELNDFVKSNSRDKTFVTACCAFFPKEESHFILSRAGHNKPILFSKSKDKTKEISSKGFALGMTNNQNLKRFLQEETFPFESGDSLLLYTDGLTEARNEIGYEFGAERLVSLLDIYGSLHAKTLVYKIQQSLEHFVNKEMPEDDITFTCIHKN